MAKFQNDGRSDELEALMDVDGVDKASIQAQLNNMRGIKNPTPVVPPADTTPPATPPTPPPATPPAGTVKNVPDTEAIRTTMLNEMFGEQFKTVDDVKKANIPASLQELATLRERAKELETQLAKKPKHSFASDDIAKFNEFARETGIKDPAVFTRLNTTDVANMDAMDALVMQHILENPESATKEPQVRRYLERRYNVDTSKINHKQVEDGDMTEDEYQQNKLDYETNLIGISSEGNKAKAKLVELKNKIKMPEIPVDEPEKTTKWTPAIETKQKEVWTKVNEKMGEEFAKIPITLKGGKEPIVNFVLPEEAKKRVMQNALDYVVSNQLEVNEANVTSVANAMYSDILMSHREEIYHAIFERARSMTEDEILKVYHNPSKGNTDTAPAVGGLTTEEEQREKAFNIELNR
jgi:hypothetical protein